MRAASFFRRSLPLCSCSCRCSPSFIFATLQTQRSCFIVGPSRQSFFFAHARALASTFLQCPLLRSFRLLAHFLPSLPSNRHRRPLRLSLLKTWRSETMPAISRNLISQIRRLFSVPSPSSTPLLLSLALPLTAMKQSLLLRHFTLPLMPPSPPPRVRI